MRSRILLAGAVVAAAMAVTPATLASGGRNPQTAGLQVALRAEGLYRGPIDAISGPATVAATRAFQRMEGLPVTGLADARTRAAMGPLGGHLFGARTLHHGAFGWDVAVLQFLLVRQGISVPVNAYFEGEAQPRPVAGAADHLELLEDRVARFLDEFPDAAHERVAAHVEAVFALGGEALLDHVLRRDAGVVGTREPLGGAAAHPLEADQHVLDDVVERVSHVQHVGTTHRVAYRTQSVASVRGLLDHWAAHYGVSVHLVRALAWMESGYNNALVSSVGARGIMQLLPSTFSFAEHVLIGRHLRHNASGNVRAGVAYLSHLLHDFHGNRRLALAGWYQGEGAVRKHGLYKVSKTFVKDVLALTTRM